MIAGASWADFEKAIRIATPAEREDGLLLIEHEKEALLDVKAANRARKDQLEAESGDADDEA